MLVTDTTHKTHMEPHLLSLHDALPIWRHRRRSRLAPVSWTCPSPSHSRDSARVVSRRGVDRCEGRMYQTHAITARATESTMKDRKSTRLNSSHVKISYAVVCLKKKSAA